MMPAGSRWAETAMPDDAEGAEDDTLEGRPSKSSRKRAAHAVMGIDCADDPASAVKKHKQAHVISCARLVQAATHAQRIDVAHFMHVFV